MVILRYLLGACLTELAASVLQAVNELGVDVVLWDESSNPVKPGGSPRYLVGNLSIGGRTQHFTFDAGNPEQPILMVEGCRGCSDGCPRKVPTCDSGSKFCWPSHSDDFAPYGSYKNQSGFLHGCPLGVQSAGTLDGQTVCMQCFGGGHARFYSMAEADITLSGTTIPNLKFGALVRTTPALDRIWSNVGIGYKSAFLTQLGAERILLHLRPGEASSVTFNPDPSKYADAKYASFRVSQNRDFPVDEFQVGNKTAKSGATFRIDTGNGGICFADQEIADALESATGGEWAGGGLIVRGLSPSTAPDLTVVLGGIPVKIPGSRWVTSADGGTIFSMYHKNVLGLPFLAQNDVVIDDSAKKIYLVPESPKLLMKDIVV